MAQYKVGDKVMVEGKIMDITDGPVPYYVKIGTTSSWVSNKRLRNYYTKKKINLTKREQAEITMIVPRTPLNILFEIFKNPDKYSSLYARLFINNQTNKIRHIQAEFIDYLINCDEYEVVTIESRVIKVLDFYLYKTGDNVVIEVPLDIFDKKDSNFYFTREDAENIAKLPKYKGVDILFCWQEINGGI